MPKNKHTTRRSSRRRQEIMSGPSKLFTEEYFTKTAKRRIDTLADRGKMTKEEEVKFAAQTAPKRRYRKNPKAVLFRKKNRTRTIMHLRY